jgi:hypothetical protein
MAERKNSDEDREITAELSVLPPAVRHKVLSLIRAAQRIIFLHFFCGTGFH